MADAVVLGYIKADLQVTRYLGISPYRWSQAEKKLKFNGRISFPHLFFLTQLSVYLTYEAFVAFRLISASIRDRRSRETSKLVYLTFTYAIPATFHLCSLYNTDHLYPFVNRLLEYRQGMVAGT